MDSPVCVAFTDFESGFKPQNHILGLILKERLGAVFVDDLARADLLIYSIFGNAARSFKGPRLFYTEEPVLPRWKEGCYSLTSLRDGTLSGDRHFRFPAWLNADYIRRTGHIEQYSSVPGDILNRHEKFCNFVYSGGEFREAIRFLETLSQYKYVDSSGQLLNNTGMIVKDKVEFCSRYKFTIAFENYASPGYITQKLTDAFAAGSLPVYWGAPDACREFNPGRFINARDFRNHAELVRYVEHLDRNVDEYLSYFKGPLFDEGQIGVDGLLDEAALFFKKIFREGKAGRQPASMEGKDEPLLHGGVFMPRYDDGKPWTVSETVSPSQKRPLGRPFNMAACIASYKRVEDLLRQILCMMNQSYPHLHVFAAVKGVSAETARRILLPHVQPFIDAGRVTLRLCPNRNQLTNFMDTVRGLDISSYDLFAKIDDDDFYDPDYFRHVADFHALLPDGYSSCHRGEGLWLKRHEGYPYLEKSFLLALGPAQVMSRRVMEDLLAWETDRAAMKEAMYRCLRQTGFYQFGFAEDQLFQTVMLEHGCADIAPYLKKRGIHSHLIMQKSNASIMRGGTVSEEFRKMQNGASTDAGNDEHLVDIIHSDWKGCMKISNGRAMRLDGPRDEADVLSLTGVEITLKWDKWGVETFTKMEEGAYRLRKKEEAAFLQSPPHASSLIHLRQQDWTDGLCITGNRGKRLNCNDGGEILEYSDKKLVIGWDYWGKETFLRREDGNYWFSSYSFMAPDSSIADEYVIALCGAPEKPWLHSTGRPVIRIRYSYWNLEDHLDNMKRDILEFLAVTPHAKRILLAGRAEEAVACLLLASCIKKRYPSVRTGILGMPWNVGRESRHTEENCPQEKRLRVNPSLLLKENRAQGIDTCAYAFHVSNSNPEQVENNLRNLLDSLQIIYNFSPPCGWGEKDECKSAKNFIQQYPEIFKRMADCCFDDLKGKSAPPEYIDLNAWIMEDR